MRDRTRWRLIFAGAFLAPMAVVKATELYLDRSLPQYAAAVSSGAAGPMPERMSASMRELLGESGAPGEAITSEQHALIEFVSRLRAQVRAGEPVRSPFARRLEVMEEPEPAIDHDQPAPVPSLAVKVQAVMGASGGNIALIGGTPHQVGETIDDGTGTGGHWIIRTIDPAARSVTFEHSSGAAEETRSVLR